MASGKRVTMDLKFYDFDIKGDQLGSLIAVEGNRDIPFDIKRVYYIWDTKPYIVRGKHAHRSLDQILICAKGWFKLTLDDGTERKEMWMDKPNMGIQISSMVWREMSDFSESSLIIVLASQHYDENDYIRNYEDFLKEVKGRQ